MNINIYFWLIKCQTRYKQLEINYCHFRFIWGGVGTLWSGGSGVRHNHLDCRCISLLGHGKLFPCSCGNVWAISNWAWPPVVRPMVPLDKSVVKGIPTPALPADSWCAWLSYTKPFFTGYSFSQGTLLLNCTYRLTSVGVLASGDSLIHHRWLPRVHTLQECADVVIYGPHVWVHLPLNLTPCQQLQLWPPMPVDVLPSDLDIYHSPWIFSFPLFPNHLTMWPSIRCSCSWRHLSKNSICCG